MAGAMLVEARIVGAISGQIRWTFAVVPWKNCRDSKFDMEQEDSKHFADFAMLILGVCTKKCFMGNKQCLCSFEQSSNPYVGRRFARESYYPISWGFCS
jgi:hypothetical protein